jgi:hypothetical protein
LLFLRNDLNFKIIFSFPLPLQLDFLLIKSLLYPSLIFGLILLLHLDVRLLVHGLILLNDGLFKQSSQPQTLLDVHLEFGFHLRHFTQLDVALVLLDVLVLLLNFHAEVPVLLLELRHDENLHVVVFPREARGSIAARSRDSSQVVRVVLKSVR